MIQAKHTQSIKNKTNEFFRNPVSSLLMSFLEEKREHYLIVAHIPYPVCKYQVVFCSNGGDSSRSKDMFYLSSFLVNKETVN